MINFSKSLFFGCEGSYNILGIPVEFKKEFPPDIRPYNLKATSFILKLASKASGSDAFCLIIQTYTHMFVHEMGHALAVKLFGEQCSKVLIMKNLRQGKTIWFHNELLSAWKKTIICVAGPMGNTAFSTCKLIAATALKRYLSWPIASILGGGAAIWMFTELLCAYNSASKRDEGDFGSIARQGNTHLAVASAALVMQCTLGIFAAVKLAR